MKKLFSSQVESVKQLDFVAALFYLCVALVFAGGVFFRLHLLSDLGLGWDDLGHVMRYADPSKTFLQIIHDSYYDAHPPFRNIVLHALTKISMNSNCLRAVAYVPGILLILLTFVWQAKAFNSRWNGLIGMAIVAFGYEYILLSKGTRPYMFFACFMLAYFIFWHRYLRSQNNKDLLLVTFFGCLSAFTHYATCLFLVPAMFVGVVSVWRSTKCNIKNTVYFLFASIVPCVFLLLQFLFFNYLTNSKHEQFAKSSRFVTDLDSPIQVLKLFERMFHLRLFRSEYLPDLFLYLWISGLLLFIFYRRWNPFFLNVLMVGNALILSRLGFYPLAVSRHSLPILLIAILPVSFAVTHFISFCRAKKSSLVLLFCFCSILSIAIGSAVIFRAPINHSILKAHGAKQWSFSSPPSFAIPEFIRSRMQKDDWILVSPRQLRLLN